MRILAWFSFSFAAAAGVGVYLGGQWLLWMSAACLLLFVGGSIFQKVSKMRCLALAGLGFLAGAFYFYAFTVVKVEPIKALYGTTQKISVQVLEEPEQTDNGIRFVGSTTLAGKSCKAMIYLHTEQEISIGTQMQLRVLLSDYQKNRPQIDRFYQSRNISAVCYQKSMPSITGQSESWTLLPQKLAQQCKNTIHTLFPQDTAAFVTALLTGNRDSLSYQTQSDLSRSGTSHLVAVSGMHVSVLLGLIFFLFGRSKPGLIFAWIILPLFAAITGFGASASRAVITELVLLFAFSFHRQFDLPTALGFSLLVLLFRNPYAISNPSLQMSYAASLGIYCLAGPIYQHLDAFTKGKHQWWNRHRLLRRLYRYVISMVAISIGAWAATAPLSVMYFQMVSAVSLLSNLAVGFATTLCFCLCVPAVLLSLVWLPLGRIFGYPAQILANYVLKVVQEIAAWRLPVIYADNLYMMAALIYGCLVLLLCVWVKPRQYAILAGTACAVVLLGLVLTVVDSLPQAAHITAVNVGQGACTVMDFGDFSAMVDCGGSQDDMAGEYAARYLEKSGIYALNLLILTHYDKDHVCGVEQLFHRTRVVQMMLPDVEDDSGSRAKIERLAQEYNVQIDYVTEDVCIRGDSGTLTIFAPLSTGSSNAACLSVLMQMGEFSALVTGDMDVSTEASLLPKLACVDLNVLEAGHHGSESSTSQKLLTTLRPEYVLISVGENTYGHPSQEVLERIYAAGAEALRTDECGDITIYWEGA